MALIKRSSDDLEPYDAWRERIEREGIPDPPVIFAGNWARKHIEDLEVEIARLREALNLAMSYVDYMDSDASDKIDAARYG